MPKTSNINVRIDPAVKAKADALFNQLGMSTSEAINIFLHKSIVYRGLPFDVALNVPNAETIAAMREVDEMKYDPNRKVYHSTKELFEALNSDDDD